MGGALSVGLGAAKTGKKVVVCGGDAQFVVHMGGLMTAGRYENVNLIYIIFDNKSNKSTAGQRTYQDHIDYLNIAKRAESNLYSIFRVLGSLSCVLMMQ
jgi:thiamine pyrophosphate-dependent acetolactate synthase large subunit-like protein